MVPLESISSYFCDFLVFISDASIFEISRLVTNRQKFEPSESLVVLRDGMFSKWQKKYTYDI